MADQHVTEIHTIVSMIGRVADRYLDGRDCLFPETRGEWSELRERAAMLRENGGQVSALVGVSGPDEARADATDAVTRRAASLVALARADALDAVGRPEAALTLVEDDLRSRWAAR